MPMLSWACMGVTDLERAYAFYAPLIGALQHVLECRGPGGMAGWLAAGAEGPLFVSGRPFDDRASASGNGTAAAFDAASCVQVDPGHAPAWGRPPGPHDHLKFHDACFRDPDGNTLRVCCHSPQ
jgi:catechol 2,3-dioxygenase-like lactoylglutathione lyase family enzyme